MPHGAIFSCEKNTHTMCNTSNKFENIFCTLLENKVIILTLVTNRPVLQKLCCFFLPCFIKLVLKYSSDTFINFLIYAKEKQYLVSFLYVTIFCKQLTFKDI